MGVIHKSLQDMKRPKQPTLASANLRLRLEPSNITVFKLLTKALIQQLGDVTFYVPMHSNHSICPHSSDTYKSDRLKVSAHQMHTN